MSILESFSVAGALLTVATSHHGELKILKYCHEAFENACMEYDEVNLRPTYKILWGVPAERLGLLEIIISNARNSCGAASSDIDEVIFEMEKFKKDFEGYVHEAWHYLMLSKDLHEKLLLAQRKLIDTQYTLRHRMMQQTHEITSTTHSTIHKKMQAYHAFSCQNSGTSQPSGDAQNARTTPVTNQHLAAESLPPDYIKFLLPSKVHVSNHDTHHLIW